VEVLAMLLRLGSARDSTSCRRAVKQLFWDSTSPLVWPRVIGML
jgi:hypothetical protein